MDELKNQAIQALLPAEGRSRVSQPSTVQKEKKNSEIAFTCLGPHYQVSFRDVFELGA